jgi:hypothetical protein
LDQQRVVVKLHDPRRKRIVVGVGVLLAVLFCAGVFELGQRMGGYSSLSSGRERDRLAAELSRLDAENQALKDQLARLETTLEVDRQEQAQLKAGLADSEGLVAELNEELAFYRRIMAPADGQHGLRVQAFEVSANGGEHHYRLRLVLVHSGQRASKIQGEVDLSLRGMLNGREASLSLQELAGQPHPFEFRYFQDVDLEVVLPAGFEPEMAMVELRPSGRNANVVATSFPWKPRG